MTSPSSCFGEHGAKLGPVESGAPAQFQTLLICKKKKTLAYREDHGNSALVVTPGDHEGHLEATTMQVMWG